MPKTANRRPSTRSAASYQALAVEVAERARATADAIRSAAETVTKDTTWTPVKASSSATSA